LCFCVCFCFLFLPPPPPPPPPTPGRYDPAVSETAIPLDQQLEEIRAQLAWVRDYL
jgi:hypothetical protein